MVLTLWKKLWIVGITLAVPFFALADNTYSLDVPSTAKAYDLNTGIDGTTQPFSVCAWVKVETGGGDGYLFNLTDSSADVRIYYLGGGSFQLMGRLGGGDVTDTFSADLDVWNLLCMVDDGPTTIVAYLNGVEVASVVAHGRDPIDLLLNVNTSGGTGSGGFLYDDVAVFDDNITEAFALDWYNNPCDFDTANTDLIWFWDFDDGTYDSTVGGQTLTQSGTSLGTDLPYSGCDAGPGPGGEATTTIEALSSSEWTFMFCVILFFVSLMGWPIIFGPVKKAINV